MVGAAVRPVRRAGRWCSRGLVCLGILVATPWLAAANSQGRESEGWTYSAEGRRDPFVSLVAGGRDVRPPRQRPGGLAGLSLNEITLRGLVSVDGEHLAVFEAPDKKTYILRGGERLFDGTVKSVTPDAVVFLTEISGPESLVPQREVRRTLNGAEAGP